MDGEPPKTTIDDMKKVIAEYDLEEPVVISREFPIEAAMEARAEDAESPR